jgi:uncharacterized protein YgbK (DUF1537 family)
MIQRCLIVADDLTGGADTGVQFRKKGLTTLFLPSGHLNALDLSRFGHSEVLIVNTDSRGMPPEQAFSAVSSVLNTYDKTVFPIIYKKIDSTLRGNIGHEIDAILQQTEIPMAFVAPSLPAQNRTVAGGILMIAGKPVALTEMARDAVSPVNESHICTLVRKQSRRKVALIDLTCVSSGGKLLKKAVLEERDKGVQILIFDATRSDDLAHIAEVALSFDQPPLLVGSAGLADEVAKRICPSSDERMLPSPGPALSPLRNFFVISGSASSVTHKQLQKLESKSRISSFVLHPSRLVERECEKEEYGRDLHLRITEALSHGHAILKVSSARVPSELDAGLSLPAEITRILGSIARAVLREVAEMRGVDGLALLLTGGETAASVLNRMEVEGLEIEGELIGGIVMSRVTGKNLAGLAVITKAGAFGEEDALEKIVEMAVDYGDRMSDIGGRK